MDLFTVDTAGENGLLNKSLEFEETSRKYFGSTQNDVITLTDEEESNDYDYGG